MGKLNKKILLVEDDEDFLYIFGKRLSFEGFTVVKAKNGEEGITATQNEKPDLIFSDVLMPQMDGVQMAEKIREFDANVPIIFLTNIKDVDHTANIQKTGKFDYLIKSNTRLDDIVKKAKTKLKLK